MTINDAIYQWLLSKGIPPGQVNDMWHAYWDSIVEPDGAFNDRLFTWLGGLGYTGTLTDRWYGWKQAVLGLT